MEAKYRVNFRWVEGAALANGDLAEQDGELDLASVRDACVEWRCKADLWDAAGFRRGWVQPDGHFTLT